MAALPYGRFAVALAAALLGVSACIAGAQQSAAPATVDMTVVQPESVGISSERLERLHAVIQDEIDKKQLAGAVTILARHGKVVDYRTYGVRDLASGAPMTKDTIFSRLLDDQTGHGRGHDDPLRGGQVAAGRSGRQICSRICASQGV